MRDISDIVKRFSIDLLLIENPIEIFYLTGLKMSAGKLLIGKKTTLFVDGRYLTYAKKSFSLVELYSDELFKKALFGKVGFDGGYTSVTAFEKLKTLYPNWVSLDRPLKEKRMVKDKKELKAMRKAAKLNEEGVKHLQSLFKEGVTEMQLAFAYERFVREKGGEKLSFDPIIAFGENTSVVHHSPTERKWKGEPIMIDVGVHVEGYASDITRSFFYEKSPLKELYELVRKSQKAAVDAVRPGVRVKELNLLVRQIMGEKEALFTHNLGHSLGLEVHEYPRLSKEEECPLQENMVITIEPGLYLEGVGGVRWEDMILVTKDGHENFYS